MRNSMLIADNCCPLSAVRNTSIKDRRKMIAGKIIFQPAVQANQSTTLTASVVRPADDALQACPQRLLWPTLRQGTAVPSSLNLPPLPRPATSRRPPAQSAHPPNAATPPQSSTPARRRPRPAPRCAAPSARPRRWAPPSRRSCRQLVQDMWLVQHCSVALLSVSSAKAWTLNKSSL